MGCHCLLWGSSHPTDQIRFSCIADEFFTAEPSAKPMILYPWPGNTKQLLPLKSNGSPGIASAALYKCQESSHTGDNNRQGCQRAFSSTGHHCPRVPATTGKAVGRRRLISVSLSLRGHSQHGSKDTLCVCYTWMSGFWAGFL